MRRPRTGIQVSFGELILLVSMSACCSLACAFDDFDHFKIGSAEILIRPQLTLRTIYDNNILLSQKKEDAYGVSIIGSTTISGHMERGSLSLTPRIVVDRFKSKEEFDNEALYLDYYGDYRTERSRFDISGVLSRDSTRATEATDTGLVRDLKDEFRLTVAPNWSYLWNERTTLGLGFYYSDVSFEENIGGGLADYTYLSMNGSISFQSDERTSFFASLFLSEYDVSERVDFTRSYGARAGLTRTVLRNLEFSGSVGYQRSDIETEVTTPTIVFVPSPMFTLLRSTDSSSDDGILWNVSVFKRFERSDFSVGYAGALQPSSRGSQSNNETVTAEYLRRIKFGLRGIVNLEFDQRTTQGGVNSALDRDSLILRTSLRWRLRPQWVLQLTHRFRWRDSSRASAPADSNALIVLLSFQHRPFDADNPEF